MTTRTLQDYFQSELRKDYLSLKSLLLNNQMNGYLGWTGYGNLGDEAVYQGYKKLFPNSNLIDFRIAKPVKMLSSLIKRDLPLGCVGLGGGTIINQSKIWLKQTEYLIEKNIPMFCVGTGVASRDFWQNHPGIHAADDIEKWVSLLKKFVYAGVRGPQSQKSLSGAGLDLEIVGDSALSLSKNDYRIRRERKVVGLNISSGSDNVMWGDNEKLKTEIIVVIKNLIKQGFEIKILPIWEDDLSLSKLIVNEIRNEKCQMITAFDSVDTYMTELDKCDLFIGLKLHSTIFATMLRIPSVMLEYRPKCLDYMESIGMENYSVRTDQVTASIILNKILNLTENYESVVDILNDRILYYRDLQFTKAKEIINRLNT